MPANLNMSTNLMQTPYLESLDLDNQTIVVILSDLSSRTEEAVVGSWNDPRMIRTVIYGKQNAVQNPETDELSKLFLTSI